MKETVATLHSIKRTSPKGSPFIGECVLCGKQGLTTADLNSSCENKSYITEEHALMEFVEELP